MNSTLVFVWQRFSRVSEGNKCLIISGRLYIKSSCCKSSEFKLRWMRLHWETSNQEDLWVKIIFCHNIKWKPHIILISPLPGGIRTCITISYWNAQYLYVSHWNISYICFILERQKYIFSYWNNTVSVFATLYPGFPQIAWSDSCDQLLHNWRTWCYACYAVYTVTQGLMW